MEHPTRLLAAVGTEAVDTAKDRIWFSNDFLPSGPNSTSQRFEPFFFGLSESLHNIRYR